MSRGMVVTNGIVQRVKLGLEGCALCMTVFIDYGGTCQGFGGYVLGGTPGSECGKHSEQQNLAAEHIVGVLRACGVDYIDECAGKAIRVQRTSEGIGGSIVAIGHIIHNDKWFNPAESFIEMERKKAGAKA
jgi:hypothetical protein